MVPLIASQHVTELKSRHPHTIPDSPVHETGHRTSLAALALSALGAVTGGEALYADMGHFGVRPIRLTW